MLLNESRGVFFFLMIEEVLEIDIGDGYKAMLTCLTLLNWTSYKWFKTCTYLRYILSHTHKYPADSWALSPVSLTLWIWIETREFTFLTSSPVMPMLLA